MRVVLIDVGGKLWISSLSTLVLSFILVVSSFFVDVVFFSAAGLYSYTVGPARSPQRVSWVRWGKRCSSHGYHNHAFFFFFFFFFFLLLGVSVAH